MSNLLKQLEDQARRTLEIEAAATQLIYGIAGRIQAAVDKALENGATAEQLAQLQDEADALKASADALGVAVAANTPPAPEPVPEPTPTE